MGLWGDFALAQIAVDGLADQLDASYDVVWVRVDGDDGNGHCDVRQVVDVAGAGRCRRRRQDERVVKAKDEDVHDGVFGVGVGFC